MLHCSDFLSHLFQSLDSVMWLHHVSSAAGAMRIPQPPPAEGEHRPTDKMIHYLTDYYALDVLRLRAVPFSNYDSDAYYMFYGDRIKIRGE